MTWRIVFALVWLAATPAYAQFLYPLGLKPQAGGGGGGGYTGPVVDIVAGAPTNQILNSLNGGPCGAGITTSTANETIFVVGVHEINNNSPAPTITAFSGGDGLPWAKLTTPGAGHDAIKTDSATSTAMFQTLEIWRARATGAGTYTPGLFLSNTGPGPLNYLAGAYICFAASNVNATNPQDVNATIAASGAGASSSPTVTGVSTTATSSLLIAAASTTSPTIDCPNLTSSFPAGFTQVGTINVTVASINYLCLAVAYKQVSAAQSGVSVTWGTSWPNWLSLVTALVP